MAEYSQLTIRCPGDGEKCVIRDAPEDAELLQAWLKNLPISIEYRGQRMASLTLEVFLALLKAERISPTSEEKKKIVAEQRGVCKTCGAFLGSDLEFDHISPVRQVFWGSQQHFQALCLPCHSLKSAEESAQVTSLQSRFSARAWRLYVESARPPPLVFEAHKTDPDKACCGIDVVRCRTNGMANNRHDFPIFCPFDNVEASVEGQLADFSFVDLGSKCQLSELSRIPYVGPGWYPRGSVEFLLEMGIVAWGHIKWSLQATAHVPGSIFARALGIMEHAWGEEKGLAKLSANSMIGLLARDVSQSYSVRSSNSEIDGAGHHFRQIFTYGDKHIYDYIFCTQTVQNASYRPLHDWIMSHEHVMVARAARYLTQIVGVDRRYLSQVKTDCIVLQRLPKKHLEKCKALAGWLYRDGSSQYRWEDSLQPLKGQYRKPAISSPPPLERRLWTTVPEDLVQHCLEGNSLLLVGSPGTGKTYTARRIIEALRLEGKKVVDIISKTHASVANIGCGAKTADHWVRKHLRHGQVRVDWLVIEELTQIDVGLWADLAVLSLTGRLNFLLLGDFKQFQAVTNTWCGCEIAASLKNSDMLFEMASGGCYHALTENRRSDAKIFDFVTGLKVDEADETDLETALSEARRLFPITQLIPDTTLTISHARRVAVNRKVNFATKPPKDAVFIRGPTQKTCENSAQDMFLWKGLRLIGCGGKVPRGVFVTVAEISDFEVTLSNETKVKHEQLHLCLRLSHCITYASSQGLTLQGRVRLETGGAHFGIKHLYVGASRATSSALLEVA
jgi:hypothetical protein